MDFAELAERVNEWQGADAAITPMQLRALVWTLAQDVELRSDVLRAVDVERREDEAAHQSPGEAYMPLTGHGEYVQGK